MKDRKEYMAKYYRWHKDNDPEFKKKRDKRNKEYREKNKARRAEYDRTHRYLIKMATFRREERREKEKGL